MLRVVSGLLGAEMGKNWEKSWDQKRLGFCVIAAVVFLPLATYSISYVSQARFGGLPNLPSSALGLLILWTDFIRFPFQAGSLPTGVMMCLGEVHGVPWDDRKLIEGS